MASILTTATAVGSSLEEMLESMMRREEKPKDVPPALPVWPTLRGRLPSSRRSLPVGFQIESNNTECLVEEDCREKLVKSEGTKESPLLAMRRSEGYSHCSTDPSFLATHSEKVIRYRGTNGCLQ